jgi:hypothetical protein
MDPWMVIHSPQDEHLSPAQRKLISTEAITYADMEHVLSVFGKWSDGDGKYESFDGAFKNFFPLHDKVQLARLKERWGSFKLAWNMKGILAKNPEYMSMHSVYHPANEKKMQFAPLWQPLDEIRDYFGEHVGLYFCWLELYTRALFWPAGLGFLVIFNQLTHDAGPDGNVFTVPYTMFFAAWSISFLSSWTRRQNELKFLWGTEGFEMHEKPRAQFKGAHVVNPETGRDDIVYHKPVKRAITIALSGCISFVLIMCTLFFAVQASLIKDKYRLSPAEELQATLWENNKWKLVSSMLNLLIIVIAGAIYEYLAYHLTMWENHRTNTEFEDSIIMKNFLFQFINNYFILFYIAVIRPFYAPCQVLMTDGSAGNGEYYDVTRCRQSDLPEIQFQLIIVFTGKTLGWRAAELVQPKIKRWSKELITVLQIKDVLESANDAFDAMADEIDHQLDAVDEAIMTSANALFAEEDVEEMEYSALQIQKAVRGHMARKTAKSDVDLSGRIKGGPEPYGQLTLGKARAPSEKNGARWARAVVYLSERLTGHEPVSRVDTELYLAERLAGGGTFDVDGGSKKLHSNPVAEFEQEMGEAIDPTADSKRKATTAISAASGFKDAGSENHISQANIHQLKGKDQRKEIKKHLRSQYSKDDNVEDEYVMESFMSSFAEFNEMVIQVGEKTVFLSHLYIKMMNLPRHARDKHRENSK